MNIDELGELIKLLEKEYHLINAKWKNDSKYKAINLKKKQVCQIYQNGIVELVFDYKAFLTNNLLYFNLHLKNWNKNSSRVNTRIKNQNSIEYKIDNYLKKDEKGTTRVNKCLNDIFGVRIILNQEYSYNEIEQYVHKEFPHLKCLNASKLEYIAIHVYFSEDSYSFPWELQIWLSKDEKNNLISHAKYKEAYAQWEKQAKEGTLQWSDT